MALTKELSRHSLFSEAAKPNSNPGANVVAKADRLDGYITSDSGVRLIYLTNMGARLLSFTVDNHRFEQ
jgi:hypothetical protein